MSPEELLKPRYKVIADFPFNDYFRVGDVLTLFKINNGKEDQWFYHYEDTHQNFQSTWFDFYPAIFRKMEWWEDRKPDEMPRYVKIVRPNAGVYKVIKVLDPSCNGRELGHEPQTIEHRFVYPCGSGYEIATEQEYLNYINSQS